MQTEPPALPRRFAALARVFLLLSLATAGLLLPTFPVMAQTADRVPLELLFAPFKTDRAAMSPDGKYLAYTLREGDSLAVVVLDINAPTKATAKVTVVRDVDASPHLDIDTLESTPGQVTWMRWVSATRLVIETNARTHTQAGTRWRSSPPGTIVAFNFDGSETKVLASARDLLDFSENDSFRPSDARTEPSAPKASAASASRAPRVVDLIPGDPKHIIVMETPAASKSRLISFATYKLNVVNGDMTMIDRYFLSRGYSTLVDSGGIPRVNVPIAQMWRFPHVFRFMYNGFFARETELNKLSGNHLGFDLSPANFGGVRSVPLCMDDGGRVLYYASNVGRDTYGIYGIEVQTGKRTGFAFENPGFDLYEPTPGRFPDHFVNIAANAGREPPEGEELENANERADDLYTQVLGPNPDSDILVRDRHDGKIVGIRYNTTRKTASWTRPELGAAQQELSQLMPGAGVTLVDWNSDRSRFLVYAESPSDPGTYFIYDRSKARLSEFVKAVPDLPRSALGNTAEFAFRHPSGESIHGFITLPSHAPRKPTPLIIMVPRLPWSRALPQYKPDVQAFASMGFAVAELGSRSAWGFGTKTRLGAATAFETNMAEDLKLAADSLCKRFNLDRHRVALYGEGLGAYAALWALQLRPREFRSVIAVQTSIDPLLAARDANQNNDSARSAFELAYLGGPERLKKFGLRENLGQVQRPVGFFSYRGPEGESRLQSFIDVEAIYALIKKQAPASELHEVPRDFLDRLPSAMSATLREMEGFLNTSLYNYDAKAGETKFIEHLPPKEEAGKKD